MSLETMDTIPLKQAEIAINRFNLAVPHHLGLLQNHRTNIEKSLTLGDWTRIKRDEINARRVIKQLKNILLEMNVLRDKISEEELSRFDALMAESKKKAFTAMEEYLALELNSPVKSVAINKDLAENYGKNWDDDEDNQESRGEKNSMTELQSSMGHSQILLPTISSTYQQENYQLKQRQACLDELELLQSEIRDLNIMYTDMQEIVQIQANDVIAVAENAEEALEHIQASERNLRKSLSYKKAMYPMMGALIGTCVGGPIGLVAGLKAGGLAAVGCGLLGFTGGSVLKGNTILQGNIEENQGVHLEEKFELQNGTNN